MTDDLSPVGPGHHMPKRCPNCGGPLEFLEEDMDEMTEGQFADYEAGMRGTAYCEACGVIGEW